MFFGQFPFALEPVQTYDIMTTGSMPANVRFTYVSSSPSDVVLLRIFYTQPKALEVFADGTLVAPSTLLPNLTSPSGANVLHPQLRTLFLVLRGSSAGLSRYDIRTTNMIQMTMTLTVSEDEFSGERLVQNLAYVDD
jgi:hypothetical protein